MLFKINELISDKEKLAKMQENARALAKDNPTEKIVTQLKSIIK